MNQEYYDSVVRKGLAEFMKQCLHDIGGAAVVCAGAEEVSDAQDSVEFYMRAEALLKDDKERLKRVNLLFKALYK